MDGASHPIDGHSIAALVILLLVNVVVVRPLSIPLPVAVSDLLRKAAYHARITADDGSASSTSGSDSASTTAAAAVAEEGRRRRRLRARLGLVSAPLAGVLILLASKTIDGTTVRKGIVGDPDGLEPFDIMLLFICLAYIAVSLDATGLLRYLAFVVSQKGGSSGPVLYGAFWIFFLLFGSLMGNDAIILSGTAVLVYFAKVAGVKPSAWVFGQFCVCNIASAVLVSSNITNLVVTSTFNINFLSYTAWMILPSLASAAAGFVFLLFVEFRNDVPRRLEQVDVNPREALVDLEGAIFGSAVFLGALIALVAGSAVDALGGVWEVTVPAAVLVLARDIYHDLRQDARTRKPIQNGEPTSSDPRVHGGGPSEATSRAADSPAGMELAVRPTADSSSTSVAPLRPAIIDRQLSARLPTTNTPTASLRGSASSQHGEHPERSRRVSVESLWRRFGRRFVTVTYVGERLPFNLLPFSFCMFILVDGVAATGWTRVFSGWYQAWVNVSGLAGCCFGIGVIGVILCNFIGTNIGMTIFCAAILKTWQQLYSPSERHLTASLYSLAFAANIGAVSFTFPASLAGLLWRGLLLQKGVHIRPAEFLRRNWRVLIVCSAVASAVILGEVAVMLPA